MKQTKKLDGVAALFGAADYTLENGQLV